MYKTQIDKFIKDHNEELDESLKEYKRDRNVFRWPRNKIKNDSFTSYTWTVNEDINESFTDHWYVKKIINPKKLNVNNMFNKHLLKSKFESFKRSHSHNSKESL